MPEKIESYDSFQNLNDTQGEASKNTVSRIVSDSYGGKSGEISKATNQRIIM